MIHTRNTLSAPIRMQSIEVLNRHLAAAIDLQGQVKQAHWNVRGAGFAAVHQLFDSVADAVGAWADKLAERTGALGGAAQGTVQLAAERSFLVPYPHGIADVAEHIFAVAGSLAAFGQSVRMASVAVTGSGDADSADLLTEVSRAADQQLWFVESHSTTR